MSLLSGGDGDPVIVDVAKYKLIVLIDHDGFMSLRHNLSRDELLALLTMARDNVVLRNGINGDPQ